MSSLTASQKEFFSLIEESSFSDVIMSFFVIEKKSLKLAEAESALGVLSHGEAIMLKFFVAVWLHKNPLGFELLEAASTLDTGNRKIISDWLMSPIWP